MKSRAKIPISLLALTPGAFGIGVTEFVIMGLLPEVGATFGVSTSSAGLLISGYALGVVIGAPALTIATARPRDETPSDLAADLRAFARPPVLLGLATTVLGYAGVFAVFTYIAPPAHADKQFRRRGTPAHPALVRRGFGAGKHLRRTASRSSLGAVDLRHAGAIAYHAPGFGSASVVQGWSPLHGRRPRDRLGLISVTWIAAIFPLGALVVAAIALSRTQPLTTAQLI